MCRHLRMPWFAPAEIPIGNPWSLLSLVTTDINYSVWRIGFGKLSLLKTLTFWGRNDWLLKIFTKLGRRCTNNGVDCNQSELYLVICYYSKQYQIKPCTYWQTRLLQMSMRQISDELQRQKSACVSTISLRWRHNGRDGVSDHQPHDCLLNRLFGCRSKKTSKLRVTGLCAANSPMTGEFPAQKTSNAENVSIWWRHH